VPNIRIADNKSGVAVKKLFDYIERIATVVCYLRDISRFKVTQETDHQIGEITTILGNHPEGLFRGQLSEKLSFSINDKTLQRRLDALVCDGRVAKKGEKKRLATIVL